MFRFRVWVTGGYPVIRIKDPGAGARGPFRVLAPLPTKNPGSPCGTLSGTRLLGINRLLGTLAMLAMEPDPSPLAWTCTFLPGLLTSNMFSDEVHGCSCHLGVISFMLCSDM